MGLVARSRATVHPARPMSTIKVFVSYSQDTPEHKQRVLDLADTLRGDGIECEIDQYVPGSPLGGWPLWMERQIDCADHVLVVCTSTYLRRYQGNETPGKGLGATWESILARQELYEVGVNNEKFVPVLFEGANSTDIPKPLRPHTHYKLPDDYVRLLRYLTKQPAIIPKNIGAPRVLPPVHGAPAGAMATRAAPTASPPPVAPRRAMTLYVPPRAVMRGGFAYPPFPQPPPKPPDRYAGMSEEDARAQFDALRAEATRRLSAVTPLTVRCIFSGLLGNPWLPDRETLREYGSDITDNIERELIIQGEHGLHANTAHPAVRKAKEAIHAVREMVNSEAFRPIADEIEEEGDLIAKVENKDFFRHYLSPYRNFP
jgi:hypothetical protein